jgi:hypothetical protein
MNSLLIFMNFKSIFKLFLLKLNVINEENKSVMFNIYLSSINYGEGKHWHLASHSGLALKHEFLPSQ